MIQIQKNQKRNKFGDVMAFTISDFQIQIMDNKWYKATEISHLPWQQLQRTQVVYRTQRNGRNGQNIIWWAIQSKLRYSYSLSKSRTKTIKA